LLRDFTSSVGARGAGRRSGGRGFGLRKCDARDEGKNNEKSLQITPQNREITAADEL